jgi:hypothetical protein
MFRICETLKLLSPQEINGIWKYITNLKLTIEMNKQADDKALMSLFNEQEKNSKRLKILEEKINSE